MNKKNEQIRSRNQSFTQRPLTRIWDEQASSANPYVADTVRCYGYDLQDLIEKRSFVDVFFLIFRGELPTLEQAALLEKLMIVLINPGPRHPATRAAMNAGVGKTNPLHILPIAMALMGGDHLGAGMIEETIRFFRQVSKKDPRHFLDEIFQVAHRPEQGDWSPVPGFGSRFGSIDEFAGRLAGNLAASPGAGKALNWGCEFAELLKAYDLGWLFPGLAAAALSDLGFQPKTGACLFQLLQAPGLLAHGLEMANKPLTAMPFPSDQHYIIEDEPHGT